MTSLILAGLLIAATILIHYETLRLTAVGATDLGVHPRIRLWMMLAAAILSHLLHIALYAAAYLLMEFQLDAGAIEGPDSGSVNDAVYFSIVCYTTLGFGDIYPAGQLRPFKRDRGVERAGHDHMDGVDDLSAYGAFLEVGRRA